MSNVRKSCMGLNIVCLITGDNVDKFCMHVSSGSKYFIINITTIITMIILWKISKFISGMMIDDNDDDYMGFYLRYKKSRTHATFSSFCPFLQLPFQFSFIIKYICFFKLISSLSRKLFFKWNWILKMYFDFLSWYAYLLFLYYIGTKKLYNIRIRMHNFLHAKIVKWPTNIRNSKSIFIC